MSGKHFTDIEEHFSSGIYLRDSEPVEVLLKRFKREVMNSGVLTDLKKREFFEKPSLVRKKAKEVAIRKRIRKRFLFNGE